MTRLRFIPSLFCLAVILVAGCSTAPHGVIIPPATAAQPEPVRFAHVRGSEESSMLLDNFTAYVAAVDGQPVSAGRKGWATPLEIRSGRRSLTVEFVRGVFSSRADLPLEAAPDANYEVRFTTDAQLFGRNSFCDFWIVDLGTGATVTAVAKAQVTKGG
jgi:hypothetical protein